MSHGQLAVGGELNDVTAVDLHHASELSDDHLQKCVEIDRGRQIGSQPANNGFARLVKFQLALERKTRSGLAFGLDVKVTD